MFHFVQISLLNVCLLFNNHMIQQFSLFWDSLSSLQIFSLLFLPMTGPWGPFFQGTSCSLQEVKSGWREMSPYSPPRVPSAMTLPHLWSLFNSHLLCQSISSERTRKIFNLFSTVSSGTGTAFYSLKLLSLFNTG